MMAMEALLSVSFGTSHEETRAKTIDAIEARLREEYSDMAFYSAWTSPRIVAKVKAERGECHDTLDEALAKMAADGVKDLVVATTCLMEGEEMVKIRRAVGTWAAARRCSVHIAEPLLAAREDRKTVARVLCDEFSFVGRGDALLLMGHGSPSASNEVYSQIQEELHKLGRSLFFVATVEKEPAFADVWPRIAACGVKRVYLAPLMIVAGDHAKNDLAGDCEDSWASQIAACGVQAKPVLRGLGEYAGIRQLVCDHVNDALIIREVELRG